MTTPAPTPKAPAGFPATPPPNPTATRPVTTSTGRGIPPWVWWIGVVVLAAVAGFFLFFWRGELTVTVTPPSAALTIGDTTGVGTLEQLVIPGVYTVSAELSGFIPYRTELSLGRNEQRALSIELRPFPEAQRLSDVTAQFMVLDQERKSLLYLNPGGKRIERLFLKNDQDDPTIDPITPERFERITALTWSPDRQLAFYREGERLRQYDFTRYDLVNQTVTDWPSEVKSIDWRPDGERVAYMYHDPASGERTLVRATKRNEEAERIFNFGPTAITNPEIRWSPDGKTIALWETNLFVLDVFTAELRQLEVGEPITAATWSPTSDRLLYETASGKLGSIRLDGTKDTLELAGPLSRATFTHDGQALIAAKGRGPTLELNRVELGSGATTRYYLAASNDLEPTELLVGEDDRELFFLSAGNPYRLTLDSGSYPDR